MLIHELRDEHSKDWAGWPAFHSGAQAPFVPPAPHLFVPWRDNTAKETEEMYKSTIKVKEDMHVSPNGIHVKHVPMGGEVEVDHVTAAGLVKEGKAEFTKRHPLAFDARVEAGMVTANEINPLYAGGEHRDAIALEQQAKAAEEEGKKKRG